MANTHLTGDAAGYSPTRRISTETKASYKTTEFVFYILAVIGVLIASAVADEASDFGTQEAWFYISLLTIGYMVSRGLAKSGSREPFDDSHDAGRGDHAGH
jgi:hypothetical protein